MFFTRFSFNPARRDARRVLRSPHVLHAAVMAAFPDASPTPEGRILWRLDNTAHGATLYVVSPRQPDMTHLAEQAGWPTIPESWEARSYNPLLDRIERGQRYRFRITANPVRSERQRDGSRGKPFGHVTAAQQEQWLLNRSDASGFRIDEEGGEGPQFAVVDQKTLRFSRRETEVTLRTASYEGTLIVTDADALRATLCHGLGRAKGYGCGLLTLAPVR